MKQIILLNPDVPANKQTLAQFIVLAGRAWITNKIKENSFQNIECHYEQLPVYKAIPAWANKGVNEKVFINYRHKDLFDIAKRAREQGRECFYVKRIHKQGYGTQYTEISKEETDWQYDIKFSLKESIFNQYADRHLAPTIYKVDSFFNFKYIMSERVLPDLLYEEDWFDFWYNDERIAVGFRPLLDEVADRITDGLELL